MAWVTTPMLKVLPPANPRAKGLGTKPNACVASITAWRLASLTTAVPFNMRDTVLGDTPARLATISKVTVTRSGASKAVDGGDGVLFFMHLLK